MQSSYYIVEGKKYYNKLQAYRAALPKGYWPHWYFYEDEFSQFNWQVEPTESLDELYRQRAQDIRARYNTVICWFSGGADSDAMVRSFVKNNLTIDELWTKDYTNKTQRLDQLTDAENHVNELRYSVVPRLQEYQQQYPWFKPKLVPIDVMDLSIKMWIHGDLDPYDINEYSATVHWKENKHMLTGSASLKSSVCHVFGIDKPKIKYNDGKWYFYFQDSFVNSIFMQYNAEQSYQEELFYWHPSCVKLLAKQAHIIKNYFEHNPEQLWMVTKTDKFSTDSYNDLVKNLIYPDWDNSVWQPQKQVGQIVTGELFWFRQNQHHEAVKNWKTTVAHYVKEIKDIYSHVDQSQHNYKVIDHSIIELPASFSKMYSLG